MVISWWRQTKIRQFFREFKYGIKNLVRWFPIIWKDRDWDQDFIYNLLAKKLEFQAKYIGDRDFHTESKRDAERMRLVVKLINLQQEEFYHMEYMDYEEVEHWFEPSKEHAGYKEWKHKTLSERYDEFFKKYPRQYKRVLNGKGVFAKHRKDNYVVDPNDKHKIALEIAHMNQERCRKLLFRIMSDHIERWWD
jgi:hypothetical protein